MENEEIYESTDLAVAAPNASGIVSFQDDLMTDVREQGYYATFAVENMSDKKKLMKATTDNKLLRDYMGQAIEVADFVIDAQTITDPETGAKTVPCVHIIAADGNVYQSASSGVVRSACDLIAKLGLPSTWDEPVSVTCKETNTAKGFRYKFLAID